jgi:hypothetical protein
MAESSGGPWRRVLALAVIVVAFGASCGSTATGTGSDQDGVDDADWIAAELPEVPDGFLVCSVEEYSNVGRRVAYGPVGEGVGDNCEVTITASTSFYGYSIAEAIDLAQQNSTEAVTVAEVDGHRALVAPMTDEGRVYGQRVGWEQAPGLVVMVEDSRYVNSEPAATEESALDLARQVVGMDRARWDLAVSDFAATYDYAGPPEGSSPEVLAEGEVAGRPWTLSAWVSPDRSALTDFRCLRLQFDGEDTGPGCATQRVVVAGTGFVTGWMRAGAAAPTVRAGVEGTLADVATETYPVAGEPPGELWVAVLPAGVCVVEVGAPAYAGATPNELRLLPGDPGAVECATG